MCRRLETVSDKVSSVRGRIIGLISKYPRAPRTLPLSLLITRREYPAEDISNGAYFCDDKNESCVVFGGTQFGHLVTLVQLPHPIPRTMSHGTYDRDCLPIKRPSRKAEQTAASDVSGRAQLRPCQHRNGVIAQQYYGCAAHRRTDSRSATGKGSMKITRGAL